MTNWHRYCTGTGGGGCDIVTCTGGGGGNNYINNYHNCLYTQKLGQNNGRA